MQRILESRNKREGRYAGWRSTGGRHALNSQCRPIGHQRAGGHPVITKAISLHRWKQLKKGR